MATNATVKIQEKGKTLCTLYVHWDGYWDGVGQDIVNILENGKLVNGFSVDDNLGEKFNGAGCLAATLIAKLKTAPGNIYLTTDGTTDGMNHYDLKVNEYDVELYHNGELKWSNA